MIGAAAGMATSVIGGLLGGSQASKMAKAQKKIAKMNIASQHRLAEAGAAEREKYSQMFQGYAEIASQNLLSSEQAKVSIMQSLGQPGTYGAGSRTGSINLGILEPTGLGSMHAGGSGGLLTSGMATRAGRVTRKDVKIGGAGSKGRWKGHKDWTVQGQELDAEGMADAARNTAGFRSLSGMVAEAEQFQNRQGELWNNLNNSIVGSVYESSAAIHKSMMESISKNMARGGSARRVGLQMAQAMQAQEQTNRTRTGELWQAKLKLEEYRVNHVQSVTAFSQRWVNNQAGIRDTFVANLNNLQMSWAMTLPPALIGASVASQTATQQGVLNASQGLYDALQTKNSGIMGSIEGITSAAQSAIGAMSNKLSTTGKKD